MREQGPESAAALESALRDSLASLCWTREDVGARSLSLCLLEKRGLIRLFYQFPETEAPSLPLGATNGWHESLPQSGGFVPGDSPIAGFLAAACHLPRSSFVLFLWGEHRHRGIVAFGFAPDAPPVRLPPHVSGAAQLAALAAWSVCELARLRGEVAIVSERLGGRKLVEQAKTLLQDERGLDEPEAYAYLRKLSRQRRTRMAEIARDLLKAAGTAQTFAP